MLFRSLPLASAGETEVRPGLAKVSTSSGQSKPVSGNSVSGSAEKGAMDAGNLLLDQIAATEKRVSARGESAPSFEAGTSRSSLRTANDPKRLQWRLKKLGVPDSLLKRFTDPDLSFGVIQSESAIDASNPDDRLLERILGRNDMVDAPRFLVNGLRAAQATGRVRICAASGQLRGWGTGSMISPRLLLTNNHVLANASVAASSLIEFNVQDDTDGQPMREIGRAHV